MRKEIFFIFVLLSVAITLSIFSPKKEIIFKKISNQKEVRPAFLIEEHKEPVHYFFKSRSFRDEYYEVTTSS